MSNETIRMAREDETIHLSGNAWVDSDNKPVRPFEPLAKQPIDSVRAELERVRREIGRLKIEEESLLRVKKDAEQNEERVSLRAATALPVHHPILVAWEKYKATQDYTNSFHWAGQREHREGSMWAAFMAGWNAHASTGTR